MAFSQPRGSKITSNHSALSVGYHKCKGCGEFSRCTCDEKSYGDEVRDFTKQMKNGKAPRVATRADRAETVDPRDLKRMPKR